MDIRRLMLFKDVVYAEGGLPSVTPVTRVATCAVIANPLAGHAWTTYRNSFRSAPS